MDLIKKIHPFDPIDFKIICNMDAAKFLKWYRPLRETNERELLDFFVFIERLPLNGFLGMQRHSNLMLAIELLHHTWLAAENEGTPYSEADKEFTKKQKKKISNLISKSQSLLKLLDTEKSASFYGHINYDKTKFQLQALASEMQKNIATPSISDFRHYGLLFSNKGKKTIRPGIKTILAYRLVFVLRVHTSNSWEGISEGQKMPRGGRPCFKQVANLVSMAFPDSGAAFDDEMVKKSIQQMTNNTNLEISWDDWPNQTKGYTKIFSPEWRE